MIARPAALILAVGTFLAILGPFGSHAVPWPQVWIYWVGLIALGGLFGFTAGELTPRLFPNLPEVAIYAIVSIFVSVPVSAAILAIEGALFSGVSWRNVVTVFPPVLVISAFVSAVAFAVQRLGEKPAEDGAPAPARALTEKLPHRLRQAAIQSLCAEDHYLRVRTDAGEALILMRLTDAIAACETLDGARTHRSWWVARSAVTDARKADGRGTLILADGTQAPVSRTYYPALREAGWF